MRTRDQGERSFGARPPTGRSALLADVASGRSAPMVEGGLVLGRYRLLRRIGAGGFGVVWGALDEKLDREVAVKIVPREGPDGPDDRVDREALAAAKLNHPGIFALYELASDADDHYLVSELVHGATLAALTKERALSDRDVARIGRAICEALAHAHVRGVVHRDVKPANVMVLAEPAAGSGFAKLTDFGIAHLASGDGITATGDVLGTIAYMAPEQAEGARITGAADVYALALTLYEAWAGVNPVRGASPAATARRVGRPVTPLETKRGDLPAEVCEAIDAALEVEPELRPEPADLAEVLARYESELEEEGGLVEPETLDRFGITAVQTRRRPALPRGGLIARVGMRVVAGAGAGSLALAALEGLGATPPAAATAIAIVVAGLVAILPRIGWLAAVVALLGWLVVEDSKGVALLIAPALLLTPVLLPRGATLWSFPALAPVLGLVGVAPLFVGVAALAPTIWRRAGLAVAGVLWLVAAEVLTGERLLFGPVEGAAARIDWVNSVRASASDAVWPILGSSMLIVAPIWLAFAVPLGLVARGRYAALDLLVGATWAVGLVFAHGLAADVIVGQSGVGTEQGIVLGAGLAALIAVTVILLRHSPTDEPHGAALP